MDPPDVIFVLAGQSNMSGRGEIQEHELEPTELPVFMWSSKDASWRKAREPLHAEVDEEELRSKSGSPSKAPAGKGPGMAFARRFLEMADERSCRPLTIGLVPTAVGGTGMAAWAPGCVLYENMIRSARSAAATCAGAIIGGVLFYQGETDAVEEVTAATYPRNFAGFISGVRGELGGGRQLPIVCCAITGEERRVPFREVVRRGILDEAGRTDGVACIDCAGLQLRGDGLHLTASAQESVGAMLAEALFPILDQGTLERLKVPP